MQVCRRSAGGLQEVCRRSAGGSLLESQLAEAAVSRAAAFIALFATYCTVGPTSSRTTWSPCARPWKSSTVSRSAIAERPFPSTGGRPYALRRSPLHPSTRCACVVCAYAMCVPYPVCGLGSTSHTSIPCSNYLARSPASRHPGARVPMHDHEDHVEQFGRVASARKRRWNEAKKRTRSIVQPYSKVHALTNDPKERRNGEKTHTLRYTRTDK